MRPVNTAKWLCIFCDEINLPAADKYNTQHVITFLRQVSASVPGLVDRCMPHSAAMRRSPSKEASGERPICNSSRLVSAALGLMICLTLCRAAEKICFVGACNPPTDAGRVRLTPRFLRHTPLMFVGELRCCC
jgi:dynein heavy chain 1